MDIEQRIKEAAENAVVKIIQEGGWIAPDYANRFKIPPDFLQDVWSMVDVQGIKRQLAVRIEQELADRIVNHIAAELSTDIKNILSVQERREAIRAVARENIERICKGEQ